MKPGWLIGFLFAWLALSLICSVAEMQADPMATYEGSKSVSVFQILLSPDTVNFSDPISGITSLWSATTTITGALWNTFWFNYSFLKVGSLGGYFRLFCLAISAGFVAYIIISIVGAVRPSVT